LSVRSTLLPALALLCSVSAVQAHHSFAAHYERSKTNEISGTVVEVQFVNPHGRIYLDVTAEDGSTERWMAETGSFNSMRRNGWSKTDLKPGDQVTVTGFASNDGTNLVFLQRIVMPDGTTKGMGGPPGPKGPLPGFEGTGGMGMGGGNPG
jgi:hypothetical protein